MNYKKRFKRGEITRSMNNFSNLRKNISDLRMIILGECTEAANENPEKQIVNPSVKEKIL